MKVLVRRFEELSSMRFQVSGRIGIVTLHRPRQRNALTQEMWKTLERWCDTIPAKMKLLIIRGAGKDFTAGSDIKEFAGLSPDAANEAFETMERAIRAVEQLSIPTIASINGPAFGAGFILSLACDLRIGSENARFGMPVGKLGITLQTPFIRRMMQILGPSRTKQMVYTALTYDAKQAWQVGILNELVTDQSLDESTFALAKKMLEQSQASLSAVKQSVQLVQDGEVEAERSWVHPGDFVEGVRAFTEKRPTRFIMTQGAASSISHSGGRHEFSQRIDRN